MTCEEFAMAGLDLHPLASATAQEGGVQQAAREHLRSCPRCSALQTTWETLRSDLRILGAETGQTVVPAAVETKLLAQFRELHKNRKAHNFQVIARWALVAAAMLALAIGINHWRGQGTPALETSNPPTESGLAPRITPAGPELGESLVASNDDNDFTLLPGMIPASLGNATVVRVQMQRSALGSLGFTVNEEHAADWIRVDLLLGDDGQPQAVRLPVGSE
jgi:predicted anti-sigma-YlaC factor YlaD